MSKAVIIRKTGGLDALTMEDREVGMPGKAKFVRNTHIGLNFIDVYFRDGLYPGELPFVLGPRARARSPTSAGVDGFKVGDRGAHRCLRRRAPDPADKAVLLPGASATRPPPPLLKGMTVQYLLKQSYPIQPGQTCLFHSPPAGSA